MVREKLVKNDTPVWRNNSYGITNYFIKDKCDFSVNILNTVYEFLRVDFLASQLGKYVVGGVSSVLLPSMETFYEKAYTKFESLISLGKININRLNCKNVGVRVQTRVVYSGQWCLPLSARSIIFAWSL